MRYAQKNSIVLREKKKYNSKVNYYCSSVTKIHVIVTPQRTFCTFLVVKRGEFFLNISFIIYLTSMKEISSF